MSSGKRVSKRSLLGTRVMVPGQDGRYYSGHVQAVKTSEDATSDKRYAVKFDESKRVFEFSEKVIIGPGFLGVGDVKLLEGQRVFVTVNNREMAGKVVRHDAEAGEVLITISGEQVGNKEQSTKGRYVTAADIFFFSLQEETVLSSIDDVRLLESRKSARLLNTDVDFSKLADVNISMEKKGKSAAGGATQSGASASKSGSIAIQVPRSDYVQIAG